MTDTTGSTDSRQLYVPRPADTPVRGRGYRSRRALSEHEEYAQAYQEAEAFRQRVEDNADIVSEELAVALSRAYAANPHLAPEMLVSAVLGGADEQLVTQIAERTAEMMQADELAPSDGMMDYWRSVSDGLVYSFTRSNERNRKYLPAPYQKISEEEMERQRQRNSPEANIGRQIWDFITSFGRDETPSPVMEVSAGVEQAQAARELGPVVAMQMAQGNLDFLTKPLQFSWDKITPDVVADPVSDFVRGTTRWGFGAVQAATDLPENLLMAATADPRQAPLGFRARIEEEGVVAGLGAGFTNAYLATGFGQATRQLFDDPGNVDTGSGFFMGGRAQEEADKLKPFTLGFYEDAQGNYLRTRSIGTASAEFLSQLNIISEDDFMYNTVSGGLDMMYEIWVDPTNRMTFKGWGDDVIKGLKNLDSKTAKAVAEHLEEAAYWEQKAAKAVDPDEIKAFQTISDQNAREALEAAHIDTSQLDSASVRARLRNTSDQELAVRAFIADEAGVIRENGRRTVLMPEFGKFLLRGRGQRLVKRLQETETAIEVKRLFRGRIGNVAATRIADAKTPEDVIRELVKGISNPGQEAQAAIRMVPHVGLFSISDKGLWVRRQIDSVTRLGKMLPPGTIINPQNGDEAVLNLWQMLDQIPNNVDGFSLRRFDEKFKNNILEGFIRAFASGDMGAVKAQVTKLAQTFEMLFIDMGYSPTTARALTRYVQNEDRLSAFRWSELANDGPINTNIVLLNDLLSSGIMIIDTDRFLDVVRRSGRMRTLNRKMKSVSPKLAEHENLSQQYLDLLAAGKDAEANKIHNKIQKLEDEIRNAPQGVEEFEKGFLAQTTARLDSIHDFWKTFTIARGAYVLRVVPEEAGRVIFTGVFDNWSDWLVTAITSMERIGIGKFGVDVNWGAAGRYSMDAAGNQWVRSSRRLDQVVNEIQSLEEQIEALEKVGRGKSKEAATLRKLLDEAEKRLPVEQANFDASQRGYAESQIAGDRTRATRSLTRARGKQGASSQSSSIANRFNESQVQQWVDGLIDRVIKLSLDEPTRQLARAHLGYDVANKQTFEFAGRVGTVREHLDAGGNIEEVFAAYFHHGPGQQQWRQYARALTSDNTPIDADSIDDALDWVNSVIREIEYVAGSSPNSSMLQGFAPSPFSNTDDKLMEAIATGKFDGKDLQFSESAPELGRGGTRFTKNPKLREHVELWGLNENAPKQVIYTTGKIGGDDRQVFLEGFANFMFGRLYGTASDVLARSPTWRRLYWKQMAQFVRMASPEAATKIVENAEKANIDKGLLDQLKTNAKMHLGDADLEDLDDFANAAATTLTRDLLFDATRKGATADATRLIVAFGDAWFEVLKTWSRANLDRRGMPIKSLMKGISGARDFSMFGSMAPSMSYEYDPETKTYKQVASQKREGVFYKDRTTDQWMYGLPMSNRLLSTALQLGGIGGVPGGTFAAPVEGLNIFGSVSPGVGPFGSIVTSQIVPNKPNWDWLRNILYPFGSPVDPEEQRAADTGISTFLPGWFKRALILVGETVPETRGVINFMYNYQRDPAYMNLKVNVAKMLNSSGNYTRDRQGRVKLIDDTERASAYLSGLWAIAQFIGPAAPTFRALAQTEDPATGEIMGNVSAYILIEELNDRRRAYIEAGERPDQAVEDIARLYGPNVELYNTPNTQSKYPGQEQSQEWWDWYRTGENQEFLRQYSLTAAFFGAVNGERNNEVANEMRSVALTSPKSLEDLVADGQRLLGYLRLNEWMKQNGVPEKEGERNPNQRRALALYKNELESYMGINFEDSESIRRRNDQIGELTDMVRRYDEGDEFVMRQMDNDIGDRVRIYITARNDMIRRTESLGLSPDGWRSARDGILLRDQMRALGDSLSAESPAFARLYQFVLQGEMVDVDDETRVELGIWRPK